MANGAIDGRFGRCCGLSDMFIVGASLQKRNETRVPIGGLRRQLQEPALLGVSSPRRMRSSGCNLKSSLRLPHYHITTLPHWQTGRLARWQFNSIWLALQATNSPQIPLAGRVARCPLENDNILSLPMAGFVVTDSISYSVAKR